KRLCRETTDCCAFLQALRQRLSFLIDLKTRKPELWQEQFDHDDDGNRDFPVANCEGSTPAPGHDTKRCRASWCIDRDRFKCDKQTASAEGVGGWFDCGGHFKVRGERPAARTFISTAAPKPAQIHFALS